MNSAICALAAGNMSSVLERMAIHRVLTTAENSNTTLLTGTFLSIKFARWWAAVFGDGSTSSYTYEFMYVFSLRKSNRANLHSTTARPLATAMQCGQARHARRMHPLRTSTWEGRFVRTPRTPPAYGPDSAIINWMTVLYKTLPNIWYF